MVEELESSHQPMEDPESQWVLYADGASNANGSGVEIILISSKGWDGECEGSDFAPWSLPQCVVYVDFIPFWKAGSSRNRIRSKRLLATQRFRARLSERSAQHHASCHTKGRRRCAMIVTKT